MISGEVTYGGFQKSCMTPSTVYLGITVILIVGPCLGCSTYVWGRVEQEHSYPKPRTINEKSTVHFKII